MRKVKIAELIARDWIGLEIEVVNSPNEFEIGIKGEVIDETEKTFRIMTEKGLKVVAKKYRSFRVKYGGKIVCVEGELTAFKPEERIMRGLMLIRRSKGVVV
ncbi:MAG: ribonuclease P protein subunit [Archaeoglobaceae archaeon]|nr:ribonuclease P protein subunit [Archaeoglobaceae archaeon]MDW8118721.1 ribonuclease P protein subunit [Archaeoglobaceae archaeon]